MADAEYLDVSDFASVTDFAERVRGRWSSLDILIHNAGIMATPFALTRDGIETQMATNHIGPVRLTSELLPLLLSSPSPRVVTVTSDEAAKTAADVMIDIPLDYTRALNPWQWYSVTKLASLTFGVELNARAQSEARGLLAVAAHPGLAATGIASRATRGPRGFVSRVGVALVGQSPDKGARSIVQAAMGDRVHGGELWAPSGLGGLRGAPSAHRLPGAATNPEVRQRVWTDSLTLAGVSIDLDSDAP